MYKMYYSHKEHVNYWIQPSRSSNIGGIDGCYEVCRGIGMNNGRWGGGFCIAICKDEEFAKRIMNWCILLKTQ